MDNKLKILNHLGKNTDKIFTMHELSRTLKIPYATFYRTIQKMTDLLIIQTIGKSKVLMINKNNVLLKHHLIISSEEEKKDFLKTQPIINKLSSEIICEDVVILFGSYAKETQKQESDIDLLIVNKKGNKSMSFSKYEILFKKQINPIFISASEFKKMLEEKTENVGKQALKNHIILNNSEDFWKLVLDGKLQKNI